MLNCPHERGIFLTLTVAVWTQSTSVTQRLSCSKHTTTVVSPPVSQEVRQEAIAAIGHVWTVLCHQGGTCLAVFCYHLSSLLSHFILATAVLFMSAVIFWSIKAHGKSQLLDPTNMLLLFFLSCFAGFGKFSMILCTLSTSKVYHCMKARTAHFNFVFFSFLLCLLSSGTM